jgi:osmoprotectant transport system permease protein
MDLLHYFANHRTEIATLTLEHLILVGIAVLLATAIGVPLGIVITRRPWLRQVVLGGANLIQIIPSLALFGFLLPVPWLGARAGRLAILALTLYALLPIVRNTYAGITSVDPAILEAARGMGMTRGQLLRLVELPLGLAIILAGIRVAAVITIGVAAIGAAIGAGGLGEFIFRGLAMVDNRVILAGAIPAAVLALAVDFAIGRLEHRLRVPR